MDFGGLSAIGGGVLGGLGGLFSSISQADAVKAAMDKYFAYVNQMRQTFLDQPESQNARPILQAMLKGDYGYGPDALNAMRAGTTTDYGYGLRDATRMASQAGVQPGNAYSPGQRSRATRLMGENLAVRKAESDRATAIGNAQQAQTNFFRAAQTAPEFMPGIPGTAMVGSDVFMGQQAPNAISVPGSLMSAAGQGAGGYAQYKSPINQYYANASSSYPYAPGAMPFGPIGQSVYGYQQPQSMAPSSGYYTNYQG